MTKESLVAVIGLSRKSVIGSGKRLIKQILTGIASGDGTVLTSSFIPRNLITASASLAERLASEVKQGADNRADISGLGSELAAQRTFQARARGIIRGGWQSRGRQEGRVLLRAAREGGGAS